MNDRINDKINELIKQVQPLLQDPGVGDFITLLKHYVEKWKEQLINAKGEEVLRLQGTIRNVRQIIIDVTRNVPRNNYKDGAYNGT